MMNQRYAISNSISGQEIKRIRIKLGLTQVEFSQLVNTSKKTVERWETSEKTITGPIVTLLRCLDENPEWEQG